MNSKHFKLLALLAVLIMQYGCAERSVREQYHEALKDAAIVEDSDITDKLLAITRANSDLDWNKDKTGLLVVAWKRESDYKKHYENETQTSENPEHLTWVTVAPQVKRFCQSYLRENPKATDDQLNLRLKQYLGLPPDSDQENQENYVFVELRVNPKDIFRPCVDPEINDTKCNREIPKSFPSLSAASIPDYGAFYQHLYFKSFRGEPNPDWSPYPWTGMGYTYDWGNHESKVGASEFILIPETPYQIKPAVVTTRKYCEQQ
jgi:hypothetical protein